MKQLKEATKRPNGLIHNHDDEMIAEITFFEVEDEGVI